MPFEINPIQLYQVSLMFEVYTCYMILGYCILQQLSLQLTPVFIRSKYSLRVLLYSKMCQVILGGSPQRLLL